MTYDELYDHITFYVDQELDTKRKSCLILGSVMEFMLDCLDEGVDVPSTQTAYMLASSSNPREFIQRRGRILRKSPGKEFAVIHDMITIPSRSYYRNLETRQTFNTERRILKKELTRFSEFAECSENRFQATEIIWDLAKAYNLLDF